jgi:hypothetical protein
MPLAALILQLSGFESLNRLVINATPSFTLWLLNYDQIAALSTLHATDRLQPVRLPARLQSRGAERVKGLVPWMY